MALNLNDNPRITLHAMVGLGKFLDIASPTRQDWRLFASHLGFPDNWIQNTKCVCCQTGESPTIEVLRAWAEGIPVSEPIPVCRLIECLRKINRIDAASYVELMMKEGKFLQSVSSFSHCVTQSPSELSEKQWCHQTCCYACQTGQHTSQTNDSTGRSKKSAQENSYHGHSNSLSPQCHSERCSDCARRLNAPTCVCEHQLTSRNAYQPHRPKNGQSVVSLLSVGKSENLPTSHWKNTKTWPLKKGNGMNSNAQDLLSHVQHQIHPREQEEPNYPLRQDDDSLQSRPFHSLVSTTPEDSHRYYDENRVPEEYGRCPQGRVDRMMRENPALASPRQTLKRASMLITYAYKNYKTAHRLASLLISKGHEVTVDSKEPITGKIFASVTYVIIIYTQDYFKEVSGNVKPNPLHTRWICELMAKEFHQRGEINLRFVPIFDHERIDRASIPGYLRKYPKEPTQYICKILKNPLETPTHGELSIQRRVW